MHSLIAVAGPTVAAKQMNEWMNEHFLKIRHGDKYNAE